MYSNFLNGNINEEEKNLFKVTCKVKRGDDGYKEQKNWPECIAEGLILEGLVSFNSPFPKHFPTILFWVPFYSNYYIWRGFFVFSFYTMLWFLQFWNYARFRESCIKALWEGYCLHLWQKYYKQNPQKVPWMPHLRSWWLLPLNANMEIKWATQRA